MITRAYLTLNAIAIALIGLAYLYDPNLLLTQYDITVENVGLDNMLRATYGGLFFAAALIFFVGVLIPKRRQDATGAVVLFMGSQALGRLASITAVGIPVDPIMLLLFYEIAMSVVGVVLYLRSTTPA